MRMVSDKVYEDTRIRLAIVAKRKMTGVDPGLDFHSTVVRVLLLLLFYSIISFRFCAVYTKIKGMSLHVSFTCLVGRVFLVYTTRRFCPSTRPASSKLERDQTTRQIKCRCTNSFRIYVRVPYEPQAQHSYIQQQQPKKENGSSCSGVPVLFSSASVAQPQKIYIYVWSIE